MKRFCPDCRTANHPNVAFCNACGCPLQGPPHAVPAKRWYGPVVAIVTLVAMVGYLFIPK